MKKTIIKDVMHTPVITLLPEMSLKEAWNCLKANRISGAPVVDEEGTLVGVISQSDLLSESLESGSIRTGKNVFFSSLPYTDFIAENKFEDITVEEAMHQGVITVYQEDKISTAAALMVQQHVHRVIVINDPKSRNVTGILSALDLVKLLA